MPEDSILARLYQIHRFLAELESTSRDYGTGEKLFPSSVHTLEAVDADPGLNLSELAECLHVTPAAAVKFTSKLIHNGYLRKGRRNDNRKEVAFWLTDRGALAVGGHRAFRERAFAPLRQMASRLSEDDRTTITTFLDEIIRTGDTIRDL